MAMAVLRESRLESFVACSMASNWFRDWDDEFFSRPSRIRLFQSDPWGSLDRLNEDLGSNDIFSDFATKASSLRNRVEQRRLQRDSPGLKSGVRRSSRSSEQSGDASDGIASPTPSSINSAAFPFSDVGRVSFPTSSCSNVSDCSDKSPESICTERSNTHSAVTEVLPEGGEQRKVDSTETWVERNAGGGVVGEGSTSQSVKTEIRPGLVQEYSKEERSYVGGSPNHSVVSMEKSEHNSSQSSSKTMTSKTLKHSSSSTKKSTESVSGKPFRVPPNRSVFYDELDSSILADPILGFDRRRRARPLDRLASLVDEVFHHDHLFQTELDSFLRVRPKRIPPSSHSFEDNIKDDGLHRYKTSNEELKRENEALQQENSRLQQVLQEVTAVNKRWQRYNNDRRVYVQKLLATIQELQEQMNQQGEAALHRPTPASSCDASLGTEVDRLKKQHEEHSQLLRLQIKSHKDDWQVERREKNKAVEEKEALAEEVVKLKQELKRLQKSVDEERCSCRSHHPHIASQHFTPRSTYQASFQVPYSPTEEMSSSSVESRSSVFNIVEEEDSMNSSHEQKFQMDTECSNEQKTRSLFLGFPTDSHLATVRAFSSPNDPYSVLPPNHGSSLKHADESIICPNCQRNFPPSLHACFLDHFEFCRSTDVSQKGS